MDRWAGLLKRTFALDVVPLLSVATLPNNLWTPSDCPLCASGVPLQGIAAFAASRSSQAPEGVAVPPLR
jgi:hypothetical protein